LIIIKDVTASIGRIERRGKEGRMRERERERERERRREKERETLIKIYITLKYMHTVDVYADTLKYMLIN